MAEAFGDPLLPLHMQTSDSPPCPESAAYEQERQLLACDLHDGLAQHLYAALLLLEAAAGESPLHATEVRTIAKETCEQINLAVDHVRILIAKLTRPLGTSAQAAYLQLDEALRQLASVKTIPSVTNVEIDCKCQVTDVSPLVQRMLVLIAHEAVTNAKKHSRSARARVRLQRAKRTLQLEIRDWGVGFNQSKMAGRCFGLRSMQARTAMIGGRITIHSEPFMGTTVFVEVSFDRNE